MARADLEQLESPAYRYMKEKALKFLTCDWHGFGYLLDCALRIIGQSITLIGIAAIIASLNIWIVLAFAALAAGSVWFEGRMRKRAMALAQTVILNQRSWIRISAACLTSRAWNPPAAKDSGLHWPGRCSKTHPSSYWTNPRQRSIPALNTKSIRAFTH